MHCSGYLFREIPVSPNSFDISRFVVRSCKLQNDLISSIILASRKAEKVLSKEKDRLELQSALIHAQESAALQILLEICLPSELEKKVGNPASVSQAIKMCKL